MTEAEVCAIPRVASFFSIGPPIDITPIREGLSNHNYAVRTRRGEYVVKFLVGQTDAAVENDVAIQRQLLTAGVGTPVYVQNRDGAYLYRGADGIRAVVSENIGGETPRRMTPMLAADIGRHLARFHTVVQSLPNANDAGLMNPGVARVSSDAARAVVAQPLPRGIIHGDLHGGNVLIDPIHSDRVVAVLDYEEAGENCLLIDLAVTAMAVSSADPGEAKFEPNLLRAAIQGYESVRVLTNDEHIWLPAAVGYAREALINWFIANGFDQYAGFHQRLYDGFRAVFGADPVNR